MPRYTGLFVVYAFFYKYRDSFSITSPLGASLQYVGQRTLDVYMLHFFFIPCLFSIGHYFKMQPNYVLELLCGLFLSVCVVALSLLVSNFLRLSPILARVLFGVTERPK